MNISESHKQITQLLELTKYGMSLICLLMTAHCGILFLGYDAFIVHVLFVVFVMMTGLRLSKIYKLCWVHRISIVYSMAVVFCITCRRHDIFDHLGIDVQTSRGVMFFLGLIMCALNIWKLTTKKN